MEPRDPSILQSEALALMYNVGDGLARCCKTEFGNGLVVVVEDLDVAISLLLFWLDDSKCRAGGGEALNAATSLSVPRAR